MKNKLIRITTADISLDGLLEGQLRFLNYYYEVIGLASDTGCLDKVGAREGIRVINVPMQRNISLLSDIKSLFLLIKIIRRERPFIVHSNTPKGSLLSMIASKLNHIPNRLYTVTGLRYQGESGFMRWLLKMMECITCMCANKVIPEGEGVKNTLLEDRITRKPLEVVYNGNISGIDTKFYSKEACNKTREAMRQELGLAADDFVFVFVGRIVRDKGMDELAEAMRSLKDLYPECKLLLLGRFESDIDPISQSSRVFFLSDDSVVFVGYQKDVRPYMLAADALVFPSYREGFPNVVMQAGSMGLPAIVTDINGCNEIITDGENGVIIPPKDPDALTVAMKSFLEDRNLVVRLGGNSRARIQERYEQEDVWNALLSMYKSL